MAKKKGLDFRKYIVVLVVAVLFAAFIFASIDAVYPKPDYDDYCDYSNPKPVINERENCTNIEYPEDTAEDCRKANGRMDLKYDSEGCPSHYECEMCHAEYDKARESHGFFSFIIASLLGLIGIAIGLWLPVKKGEINEWIGTGIMLGGLFCIFLATMMHFGDLHRFFRPIVLLAELILVIYLSYKKLRD